MLKSLFERPIHSISTILIKSNHYKSATIKITLGIKEEIPLGSHFTILFGGSVLFGPSVQFPKDCLQSFRVDF